ncbi:hypothetical protein D7V54_23310 [Escherichia coli]|nr:hypothetical protein [Escherichia coli]EEV6211620.1 hypothetical protein [Escherichia coli]EEV8731910.1 hypothetical protein [Escherichia coli]EEW0651454.1 hypothetical protein [Escherichia coli]EEY5527638.1 hypothetical protein [Escherichia coli]
MTRIFRPSRKPTNFIDVSRSKNFLIQDADRDGFASECPDASVLYLNFRVCYMNASRLQGIHCFDITGRLLLYIRLYCSRNAASPYVIRRLTPYFHGGLQAQNTLQV